MQDVIKLKKRDWTLTFNKKTLQIFSFKNASGIELIYCADNSDILLEGKNVRKSLDKNYSENIYWVPKKSKKIQIPFKLLAHTHDRHISVITSKKCNYDAKVIPFLEKFCVRKNITLLNDYTVQIELNLYSKNQPKIKKKVSSDILIHYIFNHKGSQKETFFSTKDNKKRITLDDIIKKGAHSFITTLGIKYNQRKNKNGFTFLNTGASIYNIYPLNEYTFLMETPIRIPILYNCNDNSINHTIHKIRIKPFVN